MYFYVPTVYDEYRMWISNCVMEKFIIIPQVKLIHKAKT